MKVPPVDVLGRKLRKGDWARLIALPSDLNKSPAHVRRVFRRALGLTFRVDGFGRYGHVELDLTKKVAHLEFIWVEPNLLRRTRTRRAKGAV
jgi:AraC-like DNA-binding protein